MKIGPVGAQLLHADGGTDIQSDIELIAAFRSYADERKEGEDSANILRI
jgi:hypothetical protein